MPSNFLASRVAVDIVQKQSDLAKVQEQIASGKRVNRPSDDPAYSARILGMREATSQLDQFNRNASAAESQLVLEEAALNGVSDSLNRIRELALSANNGLVDDYTRAAVNAEVKLRLDELYDFGNSRDSYGNFLFGGSNTQTPPFAKQDPVVYSGGDRGHDLAVSMSRTIRTADSGKDVFMRLRDGNGNFTTKSDIANTGTGIINQGQVSDPSVFDSTPYRIDFTSGSTYDVFNDDTGALVSTSNTYSASAPINIDGRQTSISGAPVAGDIFRLSPSQNQDIFSTVSKFVDALERSPNSASQSARMAQDINTTINALDTALDHINTIRASVGTRLNSVDTVREENSNIKLQLERTLAGVEDIDIAEAVTNLQETANSLEILQKSYARIEGLSLFNYM
ncbi:MAG: flagellar hook-associated protein 3 FlgL [Pseudomonadales bacterium]|jgi:flagellar hook-associated protein 3 FlgL